MGSPSCCSLDPTVRLCEIIDDNHCTDTVHRGYGGHDGLGCSCVPLSFTYFLLPDLVIPTVHARSRGAETWWKSFTTGKSAEQLGGIPHDKYGMTSLSIRQYVLGIYKQLGLREKDITKVQTGGPGMCPLRRITRQYC